MSKSVVVVNNYYCISRAAKIWRFKICAFFLLHLFDLTHPLKGLDDVGSPPLLLRSKFMRDFLVESSTKQTQLLLWLLFRRKCSSYFETIKKINMRTLKINQRPDNRCGKSGVLMWCFWVELTFSDWTESHSVSVRPPDSQRESLQL